MTVKSYIFAAATGRCGTGSLARILAAAEDIQVKHEPEPVMYNDYPDNTTSKSKYFSDLFLSKKLPSINQAAKGYSHYAETSHLFIKNFAEHATGVFGNKLRIIHLVRDPVEVATSFYRIGSIPGKTARGKLYLLDPEADDNILDIRSELQKIHKDNDLYRCLWYWYEIEARVAEYKKKYPEIPVYQLSTHQLNDFTTITALLDTLNLFYTDTTIQQVIGIRENLKLENKINDVDTTRAKQIDSMLVEQIREKYGDDHTLVSGQ